MRSLGLLELKTVNKVGAIFPRTKNTHKDVCCSISRGRIGLSFFRQDASMQSIAHSFRRAIIKLHRKALAREVFKAYHGEIQHGPFAGMRYDGNANISEAAHGLKIFGLYEQPVMNLLLSFKNTQTFIDIGAGDGYYPVGLTSKCGIPRAICFEMTTVGREAIARNARTNGVSDKIEIHAEAGADFLQQLVPLNIEWSGAVFLIDIEGFEFTLLDESLLAATVGARYVIELHDGPQSDGRLRKALIERMSKHWHLEILGDRTRDWGSIAALKPWHDLDRAVLLSEGRKLIGEWLVATPK